MKQFGAGARALAFSLLVILAAGAGAAAQTQTARPLLGAQIWIEPGQRPEDVERWFKTLADGRMPVARLFLMWNYMEREPGVWDFALYDQAFRAAEKYHVRVVATLTPNWGPAHRGYLYASQGGPINDTETRLAEALEYVGRVVARYRTSPALDSWMLMNEPGQRPAPDRLALQRYRLWLAKKYGTVAKLNEAWMTDFASFTSIPSDPRWTAAGFDFTAPAAFTDWQTFWRAHLAWYLGEVAAEVRRADPTHHVHVNPHALVGNLASNSFDLPEWRSFLDSLGASIHPSWHFGLLKREQFALGVSYVCDLVRGASEPHPFWVTELQGGPNLYSSVRPMSPTREDIAQWVWTGVGAGADRVIFWLLNARAQGSEAGEWSLLDFRGRASDRFDAASDIARVLERNASFFERARPVESPVTVILSLETMTLQERFASNDSPARGRDAHVLEALGLYQALNEVGIPARLKHIDDFDWRDASQPPRLVILPHVTALTAAQARNIETFVRGGNTLLVTGLTGFYDNEARFLPSERWPLADLLGARPKEVQTPAGNAEVVWSRPALTLPSLLWLGEIENDSAEVAARQGERVTAVRKRAGRGEAVWIPSPVGMGAWFGDGAPLAGLLADLTAPFAQEMPFRFEGRQPGCLLRVLQNGNAYVTVVANGTAEPLQCRLRRPPGLTPQLLWGDSTPTNGNAALSLGPRQTAVHLWR
ncbi:MAG: beta-galactosidase [Acidobacteria bacterium]|nr:beta-galactosidase [Acidobacteriota bacterium]